MGKINLTWWNLGNFFDTEDDPISDDFEYTAAEGWTNDVFEAKKTNLANALNATHDGEGPELLAVAEIEKDTLFEELITAMNKPHLKVVKDPEGTKDYRGIDVSIAYDERKLELIGYDSHLIHLRYRTRDVFEVEFKVKDTGEKLIVFACHWPSRKMGRYRTEPLRVAVAEHIAFLVEDQVKFTPEKYLEHQENDNFGPVGERWETKIMVVGDFNDEPANRSVVDHLKATNKIERVTGKTNELDEFIDVKKYRKKEVFLFNTTWKFLAEEDLGTYFIESNQGTGERFTNRYQILDQLVVSRGLLSESGLRINLNSVKIFNDNIVATPSGRPRNFDKKKKKGTSDHNPLTAQLLYD